MRELNIAYGNSRSARQWSNKTVRFDALKERLKVTIRTSESAEEYACFPKSKRDAAKDHGGFVAGVLKGGRRKVDTVASRSMVALDGDRITPEFLERYEKDIPYASALYTTHSHTPDAPRVRLVFPLARDVSPEEYVAVARYLAQTLGIILMNAPTSPISLCIGRVPLQTEYLCIKRRTGAGWIRIRSWRPIRSG